MTRNKTQGHNVEIRHPQPRQPQKRVGKSDFFGMALFALILAALFAISKL